MAAVGRQRSTAGIWNRMYTSSASPTTPTPLAYLSLSSHPHFNLSLEHYLLRSTPAKTPLCLLYRNDPCIVIGRNQNPWRELDVTRMKQLGIHLVRRRSGGGAVYHDQGNTNYSFHIAREDFTRQQHAELVARALNQEPISLQRGENTDLGDTTLGAYVNKRNDICISLKNQKDSERKISGSAYKIISSRAYHHGTMLLSSNLSHLGSALKPSRRTMQSKGVESVPSPVSNLVDAFESRKDHLSHDHFCQAVLAEFQKMYSKAKVVHVGQDNYKDVQNDSKGNLQLGWKEMDSWEWTWGQTPEFQHRIRSEGMGDITIPFEIDLHVKQGLIQSVQLRSDSPKEDHDLQNVVQRLKGKKYDVFADAPSTLGGEVEKVRENGLEAMGYKKHQETRETSIAKALLLWLKSVL